MNDKIKEIIERIEYLQEQMKYDYSRTTIKSMNEEAIELMQKLKKELN